MAQGDRRSRRQAGVTDAKLVAECASTQPSRRHVADNCCSMARSISSDGSALCLKGREANDLAPQAGGLPRMAG